MSLPATPHPTFGCQALDTSPDHFGPLRPSIDAVEDRDELYRRLAQDGYLFLPGFLDRDQVVAARLSSLECLAELDLFQEGYPLVEGVLKPGVHKRSADEPTRDNPALQQLLYAGRMMELYEFILGGPIRHYDYTWFRAKTPTANAATEPHCDIVYMGRGSKRVHTSWTPLGDVPYEMGGLMILEKSHLQEELKQSYGQTDVDVYCENEGEAIALIAQARGENRELSSEEKQSIKWTTLGAFAADPITAQNQVGGRWLSAEYSMGDLIVFGMYLMHGSHDNQTDRIRISTDSRYQLAAEPMDERWVGKNPIMNSVRVAKGMIC